MPPNPTQKPSNSKTNNHTSRSSYRGRMATDGDEPVSKRAPHRRSPRDYWQQCRRGGSQQRLGRGATAITQPSQTRAVLTRNPSSQHSVLFSSVPRSSTIVINFQMPPYTCRFYINTSLPSFFNWPSFLFFVAHSTLLLLSSGPSPP